MPSNELKCPRCNINLECFCNDVGGVDYIDEYILICRKCGFNETTCRSGGSPLGENWCTECPFCGKSNLEHSKLPTDLVKWLRD
jgi:hypothetical protein